MGERWIFRILTEVILQIGGVSHPDRDINNANNIDTSRLSLGLQYAASSEHGRQDPKIYRRNLSPPHDHHLTSQPSLGDHISHPPSGTLVRRHSGGLRGILDHKNHKCVRLCANERSVHSNMLYREGISVYILQKEIPDHALLTRK